MADVCVFSLGYRCSAAGILKSLGIKHASYPFDWMVSRLPVIEDCMATDFAAFLDPTNYRTVDLATYHYPMADADASTGAEPLHICDEHVQYNVHYASWERKSALATPPPPWRTGRDAYAYPLMVNHRRITEPADHAYYERCVERWRQLMAHPTARKLGLYVHPLLDEAVFAARRASLLAEVRAFFERMTAQTTHLEVVFVFPVRTPYASPTSAHGSPHPYILEEIDERSVSPTSRATVCALWANRDFVDAGEIFMGTAGEEIWVLQDYMRNRVPSPPSTRK
jgi:hypothetical protein